jgi:hypothetical protein
MKGNTLLAIGAALGGSAVVYEKLLRAPILTWGATTEEAGARFPGDELLEHADRVATRAITIEAPASAVWPWIAQMGPSPRGGAYTYDWIENLLGLNMHSADRVLPEFQHPRVGDGFGYGANKMSFAIVEPDRVLAAQSADGNWIWTFILREQEGRTRLISRNHFRLPRIEDRIGMIPMEPASLVMERKMLVGIKKRAEQLATERGYVTDSRRAGSATADRRNASQDEGARGRPRLGRDTCSRLRGAGIRVEDVPEVVRPEPDGRVRVRVEAEEQRSELGGGVAAERVRRPLQVRAAELPDTGFGRKLLRR